MRKREKRIYLDYAATTPLDKRVFQKMLPFLKDCFGNPSSIHSFGQQAKEAVDKARKKVAKFLNCSSSEIIFTGSATEANNLAIFGTVKACQRNGINHPHIITSQIEHHAILEPCHQLEKEGVKVTYLPVNKEGIVKVEDVKKAICKNTVLVTIMYANNEIGTIQPIAEIGKLIRKLKTQNSKLKVFFHTDAVQAINYLDCDVQKLKVDLLTISAHKIYGPKGVGGLYIRKGTKIEPQILGGGHEGGLRSGTENVAGIVGLGEAIEIVKKERSKIKKIKKLRDKLIDGILKQIPGSRLNGSRALRLPNNVNISIPGIEGESMVIALDEEGIACSTGSACSSGSLEPSHVLLSLGLPPQQAHSSLRLTLGKYTTEREIDKVLEILPKVVKRLKEISPF